MNTITHSTDPMVHADHIRRMLQDLIRHARQDIEEVNEPRFQALLETTAEVLGGLDTAFEDFKQGKETAWKR